MAKKFEEFIKEDLANEIANYYYALEFFIRELRLDFQNANLDHINISQNVFSSRAKIDSNEIIFMFSLEVGVKAQQETKLDIPDFFLAIREIFKDYEYIKMEKDDSTAYYNVLFNLTKLYNKEIFWQKVSDFLERTIQKNTLNKWIKEEVEKMMPNVPEFAKNKYGNLFKSIIGVNKFNL